MLDRNLRLEIHGELGLTSTDIRTAIISFPIALTVTLLLCIINILHIICKI